MTSAAIVLAGGSSTRMGTSKAWLEWHGSTLLRRAAGIVARCVDGPVVVVCAAGQQLPPLPAGVEVAVDARPQRGPLQGIAAGLLAVGARAEAVFVCGVDTPLLHPALVARVLGSLGPGDEVALPRVDGFAQPLAAAYRTTIAPRLEEVLRGERLGTRALLERCSVRELDEAALLADPAVATLDPQLDSLRGLNDREAYAAARARDAPEVTIRGRGVVRAATLGAAGVGPATIGKRAVEDPEEPLVAGDVLNLARS